MPTWWLQWFTVLNIFCSYYVYEFLKVKPKSLDIQCKKEILYECSKIWVFTEIFLFLISFMYSVSIPLDCKDSLDKRFVSFLSLWIEWHPHTYECITYQNIILKFKYYGELVLYFKRRNIPWAEFKWMHKRIQNPILWFEKWSLVLIVYLLLPSFCVRLIVY